MARGFGTTDGSGTTDVVTTGYQTAPTTVTYSIWAYITGAGGGNLGRLFDKDSAGAGKRQLYYNTTTATELWFEAGFSTTDGNWRVVSAPATGGWHHILITYDGGNVANVPVIYFDGISQTVETMVAPVGTIDTSATNYLIGNRADGIRVFNGRLAEFAQWARILNATEITNLASGTRADVIATPDFYFRLLGNDSPEPNYIITGTDGTLTGTAKQTHPTQVPVGIVAAGVVESLRTDTSDPMTWSHNVGTTGPKGVLVGIMHGTSSTDHVSTVTYGSKSLTRVQRNTDTATEPGAAEWWFGGTSIPTGTQTVTADLTSGTTDDILGVSISLDADQDLEVIDVDGINENAANPSVTMNVSSRYAMSFAAFYSGLTDGTSITAGTGSKKITSNDLSGNFTAVALRQKVTARADFAMATTSGTDDVAYAVATVSQVVLNTTVTPGVLTMTTTGYAPTVTTTSGTNVTPDIAVLTITTYAPTVLTPRLVTPDIATLTTSTFIPTVTISDNRSVTPGIVALTTTTFAPTVSISNNTLVTPDIAALTLATFAPVVSVTNAQTVVPGVLALTLTTFAPTIGHSMPAGGGTYTISIEAGQDVNLIFSGVGAAVTPLTLATMGFGR